MSQAGLIHIPDSILPPDVATRFDGNTGVATPSANTITILGTGSLTTSASGSTLSISLTGLTNHSVLLGAGTSTITSLANGTTGQILTANTGANPSWQAAPASGITLTPDSGGALGPSSTFNIIGQQAGTVPTMETYGSGTTIAIADQTWQTQYVVDPSTTPGLKGTFTTISAAMAQAVTDGNAISTYGGANIQVRAGTYPEDLAIGNNYFRFQTFGASQFDYLWGNNVILEGNVTIDSAGVANFTNFQFAASAAQTITIAGVLNCTDCYVDTPVINTGTLNYSYCIIPNTIASTGGSIAGTNTNFVGAITLSANAQITFYEGCVINSSISDDTTCAYICYYSNFVGAVLTISSYFYAVYCTFNSEGINLSSSDANFFSCDGLSLVFSGAAYATILECTNVTNLSGSTSAAINMIGGSLATTATFTGNFYYSGLTSNGNSPTLFSGPTPLLYSQSQGNILQTTRTAISYSVLVTDYYIGVTNTSSARTITLPDPSTISPNQAFIIKDESGGAHTHNITVTPAAGLIDGAASQVITQNYGSFTVTNDGTNYFII